MRKEDDEWFKWCITRALSPVLKHAEHVNKELLDQAIEVN